jgi:hypothetical protein
MHPLKALRGPCVPISSMRYITSHYRPGFAIAILCICARVSGASAWYAYPRYGLVYRGSRLKKAAIGCAVLLLHLVARSGSRALALPLYRQYPASGAPPRGSQGHWGLVGPSGALPPARPAPAQAQTAVRERSLRRDPL